MWDIKVAINESNNLATLLAEGYEPFSVTHEAWERDGDKCEVDYIWLKKQL